MSTRHLLNETWLIYISELYSVEWFAVNLQVFTKDYQVDSVYVHSHNYRPDPTKPCKGFIAAK